jgi:uncharacterized protein (DUF58 family)
LFANFRQAVADWIFRIKVPEAAPVTLVQRRIYILPTRQGYLYALVLVVMLFASINYALALGFLLTFLLTAMGAVAMLHTWRNLSYLRLRPGRCEPVFAGDTAHFGVTLETPGAGRFAVAVRRIGEEPAWSDVTPGAPAPITIGALAGKRGLLDCGRLEIFTRYPVGLFHAWAYFDFGQRVLVYPRPDTSAGAPPALATATGEGSLSVPGDEEFHQLRPYHAGDPPRQIAWKALARGQGLQTKEFHAMAADEVWLSWDDTGAAFVEARLSVLAHWVLECDRRGQRYGLKLPGVRIAPGSGDVQRERALEALALHGIAPATP